MFSDFAQMISAAGQARATARLAREMEDEMQKRQDLAYDAERWPHCMDATKTSSRHSG